MEKDSPESITPASEPSCGPVDVPSRDYLEVYKTPILWLAIVGLFALPPLISLSILLIATFAHVRKPELRPGYCLRDSWKTPQVQKLMFLYVAIAITHAIFGLVDQRFYHINHSIGLTKAITLAVTLLPIAFVGMTLVHAVKQVRALLRSNVGSHIGWQLWTDATYASLIAAFVASILSIWFMPIGPGQWICGWLLASANDAGLVVTNTVSSPEFETIVKSVLSFITLIFIWAQLNRAAVFFTNFCKRQATVPISSCFTSLAQTLRRPTTRLKMRDSNPLLKNVAQSFWWLFACYAFLFWLIGFSGGALGNSIKAWLDFSIRDANIGLLNGASDHTNLRIFCAAIFALYGTVPLAVTGCNFLPYLKRRQVELTDDGISFPDGPYLTLGIRQMRLWSDLASVRVKANQNEIESPNTKLMIKFQSGGSISLKLSQLDSLSLDALLSAIDEHAGNCIVTDDVVTLRANTRAKLANYRKNAELSANSESSFQSTIFVPHDQGAWLPDGETRVVRLLASRPLSCVYLVRMNTGNLAVAKQFFLADHTEQNFELQKSFQREYQTLSKIDHPRIAKVQNMFEQDGSTYLVIEHTPGTDLHKLVSTDGVQSEELVLNWAMEICDIMIALHSHNPPIVHRDLTPDNLVLTDDGHLHVIDFGAAHQFMEGITGTIIGKQCYVPLEQLQGQAGPRSDIYAFGCTLHYLLTGNEPIALSQCKPMKTRNISPSLNALIMTCTELDQDNRPASFQLIRDQIIQMQKDNKDVPERVLRNLSQTLINMENITIEGQTDAAQAPSEVIHLKHTEEIHDECR